MKFIAIVFLSVFVVGAHAQTRQPPVDMRTLNVKFRIHCVASLNRMIEVLAGHGEKPVMLSTMSTKIVMAVFTNKNYTQSTLVVARKSENTEEACILWSGTSNGQSFALDLNTDFPIPLKKEIEQ